MRRCEEILRNILTREKTSSSKKAIWNFSMANKTKSWFFKFLNIITGPTFSFKKKQVLQEEEAHLGNASIT